MITPPFSPQYFAVGRYSLLKIFFVCVCSKKNNVTFFSPRFFISFLLWKSKVGSAKVDFLPQSMPSGAMRVLMKVLAFLGTAQLACGWPWRWLTGWPWRWKGGYAAEPGAGTALALPPCPCCSTSAFDSCFAGAGL